VDLRSESWLCYHAAKAAKLPKAMKTAMLGRMGLVVQ
jgi:hypothetical protein